MRAILLAAGGAAMLVLGGCAGRDRTPPVPALGPVVPDRWPTAMPDGAAAGMATATLDAGTVVRDPRLRALIDAALDGNRDLAAAAADIAAARARLRITEAGQRPVVGVSGGPTIRADGSGDIDPGVGVDIGVTGYEVDLFGRLAALSQAERARYFASLSARRAVRSALIADIVAAWVTHAAEQSLARLADDTAENARGAVRLTQARLAGGVAPRTDVRQAEQILETALGDAAQQRASVGVARNALQLLVGGPVDPALLESDIARAAAGVGPVGAGVSSDILLARPDVIEAEWQLRAASADIGAARAALFPTITLTGIGGIVTQALGALITGDSFALSAGAGVRQTIFGRDGLRGQVALTEARRDAALALYERAIQSAFRDTADALVRADGLAGNEAATRRLVAAAADAFSLVDARYRGGIGSFLDRLDAQRSLYAAQRRLIDATARTAINRADLLRAIGADLPPGEPPAG